MSVTATIGKLLTATETMTLTGPLNVANDPVTHIHVLDQYTNLERTLNASSTPAVSMVHSARHALAAGAETLDLAALDGPTVNGTATALDMTGLRVQVLYIRACDDNTAAIEFDSGAANPYDFFGDASGHIALLANAWVLRGDNESLENVDATHKTIDVSSTDVDAEYDIIIIAG